MWEDRWAGRIGRVLRLAALAVAGAAVVVALLLGPTLIRVGVSYVQWWASYSTRSAAALVAVGLVPLLLQLRGRGDAARPSAFDRACGAIVVGGPLSVALWGAILAMLATWAPHYLCWPWWADTDHFAVSALSWRRGVLPYRDLVDYNFPGPIYLHGLLGAAFGWGRTWPFYAFDAAWLVALLAALAWWSRRMFGTVAAGGIAGLFAAGMYLSFPVPDVAQRDWYAATLALLALMVAQGSPGPGPRARLASAALLAASLATRPYALLFAPAVALAASGEPGPAGGRSRRVLGWAAAFLGFAALAFLPLLAAGVLDDFARDLAYLRPGGGYNRNSTAAFRARLLGVEGRDGRFLAAAVGAAAMAAFGPARHRPAARAWLLALAGAALYYPLGPVPHVYLRQPELVVSMAALGFVAGAVAVATGLRGSVRLLAVGAIVAGFLPPVPTHCDPRAALRALTGPAGGDGDWFPPGEEAVFRHQNAGPDDYRWGDYLALLDYLRRETSPTTRVANVLRRYPNPPVNGPSGRLTPFPHASGILWFRWMGPGREEEFAAALRAAPDAVVVWSPGEEPLHPDLAVPRIEAVIRRDFRPEARFGAMEVWRRPASPPPLGGVSAAPAASPAAAR